MNKLQLDPFAEHLLGAYGETAAYSRQFRDERKMPPTSMAKLHHLRSLVQAFVTDDERYELHPAYVEFGRVQCLDRLTGYEFVLRSASAVQIETAKRDHETAPLFDAAPHKIHSKVRLLINEFTENGLCLSEASAAQRPGRTRLEVSGAVQFIALWPYTASEPEGTRTFDQGVTDDFKEVGRFGINDQGDAL